MERKAYVLGMGKGEKHTYGLSIEYGNTIIEKYPLSKEELVDALARKCCDEIKYHHVTKTQQKKFSKCIGKKTRKIKKKEGFFLFPSELISHYNSLLNNDGFSKEAREEHITGIASIFRHYKPTKHPDVMDGLACFLENVKLKKNELPFFEEILKIWESEYPEEYAGFIEKYPKFIEKIAPL